MSLDDARSHDGEAVNDNEAGVYAPGEQSPPKRARTEKTHILDNAPRAMNVGQSSSLTPASLDQPQQVSLPFCVYAPSGDVLVSSSADIRDAIETATEAFDCDGFDWDDELPGSETKEAMASVLGQQKKDPTLGPSTSPPPPFAATAAAAAAREPSRSSTPFSELSSGGDPCPATGGILQSAQAPHAGTRFSRGPSTSSTASSCADLNGDENVFARPKRLFDQAVEEHKKLRQRSARQQRQIDALHKRLNALESENRSLKVLGASRKQ